MRTPTRRNRGTSTRTRTGTRLGRCGLYVRAALPVAVAGALTVPLVPLVPVATAATAAVQPWQHCREASPASFDKPPPADAGRFGYGVLPAIEGVTCLINEERQRLGLRPLSDSAELRNAANGHVTAALAQKWWDKGDPHQNPQVSGTPEQQIVNRIRDAGYCANGRSWSGYEITYNGWGGKGTPREAVNWWLNVSTEGHAEIIRDPSLTEFGIAPRGGAAEPAGAGFGDAGTYVVTLGRCEK
ncbi:CAP domain-containing protein [Streptomyces sp. NBC_01310]|uniref:CAP domain-containing protein n=1 Tax=Streptomyces sp. NBC_01310 TaxID=2903820 RepID=UPI0035B657D5|nr:CAP domain-containing protein [Streptomyces sp. NBC_01310]